MGLRYRAYVKQNFKQKDGSLLALDVVSAEGDCDVNGSASFESADKVEYVLFMAGPLETETVAGRLDIGKSGKISVQLRP